MSRLLLFSWMYGCVRWLTIRYMYLMQRLYRRPKDLESVIDVGDRALIRLNQVGGRLFFSFSNRAIKPVSFCGLAFPSPITFAAFKGDLPILNIWYRLGIGGGCVKTILTEPRSGNDRPRGQEVGYEGKKGLINAYGLPGKGVEGLIKSLKASQFISDKRIVGLSIGGHCVDDYLQVVSRLEEAFFDKKKLYYELNLSCPNTPEGQSLLTHPELFESLLVQMRALTAKPIGIKLSPDQSNKSIYGYVDMTRS